jgi:hypothetical protein
MDDKSSFDLDKWRADGRAYAAEHPNELRISSHAWTQAAASRRTPWKLSRLMSAERLGGNADVVFAF